MANNYYDHGAYPAANSLATSNELRAEFDAVEAGFNKLPTLSANAGKKVVVNGSSDGLTVEDDNATNTAFTPAGGIAATNVQAAIAELDTEKAPKASPIFTGTATAAALTVTGNATLGDAEATDTHSVKGATTVLANSANPALKVTQTGIGNAFVVEDVASDTTPFVIDADGRVTICGATPASGAESLVINNSSGNEDTFVTINAQQTGGTDCDVGLILNSGIGGECNVQFQNSGVVKAYVEWYEGGFSGDGTLSVACHGTGAPNGHVSLESKGNGLVRSNGGFQINKTAVTAPADTDGNVFSGTYTPTITGTANMSATPYTGSSCQYMRVGNTITVSGQVTVDPTNAATNTSLRMTLPVTSAFTSSLYLAGTCAGTSSTNYGESGGIIADATNDAAEFRLKPVVDTSVVYAFTFTYQVA